MRKQYFIFFLLFAVIQSHAQNLTLDFESGNRSTEQGNCWVFGAFSYSNNGSHVIADSWSGRSNSMSNPSPSASWIKTPWFKPGSGNITFRTKLENTTGTSSGSSPNFKGIRLRFIPFDANDNFKEGDFLADSVDYVYAAPYTSAVDLSFPMPAAIANSDQPYKLMISFLGHGGSNRANLDNLVIPGTYWTDPSNNCLPISAVNDTDQDGVADPDDNYPNDPYKAFDNFYPASGAHTLLFEDLWPATGDYDMNDLVVDYRYNVITNANNEVAEVAYTFVTRAVGAGLKNGFAFQLDGISPNKISRVSGTVASGAAWIELNANGTEAGQQFANILVMDNAYERFNPTGAVRFVNVLENEPLVQNDTIQLVVHFLENGNAPIGGTLDYTAFTPQLFNPYLIAGQDRGKEIHLPNRVPSDKMNASYFGQNQDGSVPASGKYFMTNNNLPWALEVPTSIPNAIEKKDFMQAYSKFEEWAQSGGILFADWFLNLPGYRNNTNLITR